MKAIIQFRAAAILLLLLFVPFASAAEQTRTYLKDRFQDGDIPTGQDFKDLIDSSLNLVDDGLTIYRIGVAGSTGQALRLDGGALVGPSLNWAPASDNPPLAPLWAGQFGFLPLEYQDASLASHFGFLQIQMASGPLPPPPGAPGPAIFVEFLVFETDANVPVTTFFTAVPEPTTAVVFGFIAVGVLAAFRRGWPCHLLE